ncbi:hypothetical protein KSP39_PZI021329 [Platanthera zijinensis]|uniref:Reverse transcriptase/retrotransposon-derived protein RNase H-like domain-containing protein n=1 Tax=Platanthera zijinensis TaxID=2320716 RepID=A0AAP0AWQ4_9ASPA
MPQIQYLGHLISHQGVATDPGKIQVMLNWPSPSNLKKLRGFLGLTGYYRRFIKGYDILSKPLTSLLQQRTFTWGEEAFQNLKKAVLQPLVLKLSDFRKAFVVETDAADTGVGAVLLQDEHPVAYFSKALGP